jgi:hypothetical protein
MQPQKLFQQFFVGGAVSGDFPVREHCTALSFVKTHNYIRRMYIQVVDQLVVSKFESLKHHQNDILGSVQTFRGAQCTGIPTTPFTLKPTIFEISPRMTT